MGFEQGSEQKMTPLDMFNKKAEETKNRVSKRLNEEHMLFLEVECVKVLEKLDSILDKENGAAVEIVFEGNGKFRLDNNEEIVVDKEITMERLLKVIDNVPSYKKGTCSNAIKPKVEVSLKIE